MAPLIFLFIIIAGITEVSGVIIEKPLTEMTLGSAILEGQNPIAFIIFNYPLEILGIIIIGTIMIMIGIIAVMSVARISKGEGFIKAINSSVLDYPKAFALAIIFWAVFLIIDGALFLASWISLIEINTGTILAVIFLIITLIVFVKLIFTLPALTKYPIKKAFQESWAFTKS
ncbi:MAG: hypothetical protein NTY48_04745, partial [Candidatus Diapherotrites archaeon]|nr:hypothetical protein [Candidatus Diapherotrites archaeon]